MREKVLIVDDIELNREILAVALGDEYEVGLTRKYRSFQNTATTYRLKLNCLDPENTPFPSGYSEWLMDVGDESSDYDGTYMEAYNLRQEDVPVIGLPFGETFDRDPVKMTESPVLSLMRSKILRSAGRCGAFLIWRRIQFRLGKWNRPCF